MDGFAVSSTLTESASATTPIRLHVQDTIAAGDKAIMASSAWEPTLERKEGCLGCVEIMTGAPFPLSTSALEFDACVRIEDTRPVGVDGLYIEIVKPAARNQNRRFAGADFAAGDVVLRPGLTIGARHVMALALLGIRRVEVYRRLRVAVFSTGSELLDFESEGSRGIRDSNGPYIQATLSELGVDVTYLGIIRDDRREFEERIRSTLEADSWDAVITTGGVSMGKFDFVHAGLEGMGADVRFHKVGIRPGHPVLFAVVPSRRDRPVNGAGCNGLQSGSSRNDEVPFFGLPGNPMATVVCLRFLVIPYLRFLHGQPAEMPSPVRVNISAKQSMSEKSNTTAGVLKKPEHLRVFWHGKVKATVSGPEFEIHTDQGSSKIKPFLTANGWIVTPEGCAEVKDGDLVDSFPLIPSSLGDDY